MKESYCDGYYKLRDQLRNFFGYGEFKPSIQYSSRKNGYTQVRVGIGDLFSELEAQSMENTKDIDEVLRHLKLGKYREDK